MRVLIADGNCRALEGFRRRGDGIDDIEIVGVTHSGADLLELV
jgi:hypothetical protein